MIISAFIKGIRNRMKWSGLTVWKAVCYELDMAFRAMGLSLYVKYTHGFAKEGRDFTVYDSE